MSVHIAGMGWVTPLGSDVTEVWEKLGTGETAPVTAMEGPPGAKSYPCFRVPPSALRELPAHPRLRRASAISRFAAAAASAALRQARENIGEIDPARTAVVFAISNGGVIYTKRFYHDVVTSGAGAASPLLFPETVFNAPASHVAALLGVTGATYTLVGDGAVGLSAIAMAEELMRNEDLDSCLVVGAEEADWLLCDAYAKWRLLRAAPPIEPFGSPPKGTIISEGAGAVVLARKGPLEIEATHPGAFFATRAELPGRAETVLRELEATAPSVVVTNANGTFIDAPQLEAINRVLPGVPIYTAAPSLGESVGAGGLWQVIIGAQILKTKRVPRLRRGNIESSPGASDSGDLPAATASVIALSCGMNQQIAGLHLTNGGTAAP